MREKRREKAASKFIKEMMGDKIPEDTKLKIRNSWGPYTSTDGTAKLTGNDKHVIDIPKKV